MGLKGMLSSKLRPKPPGRGPLYRVQGQLYGPLTPGYELLTGLLSRGHWFAWQHQVWRANAALLVPSAQVLELGCGTGRFASALVTEGWRVIGADPARPMLTKARAVVPAFPLVRASGHALPFKTASFDGVVAMFVPISILYDRLVWAEIGRVLRPGGVLLALHWVSLANPALKVVQRWVYGRRARDPLGDLLQAVPPTLEVQPHQVEDEHGNGLHYLYGVRRRGHGDAASGRSVEDPQTSQDL